MNTKLNHREPFHVSYREPTHTIENLQNLHTSLEDAPTQQKPAGKMKFILFIIGAIFLQGIELHKHRHGHHSHSETGPMCKVNYSEETNQISEEVGSAKEINPMKGVGVSENTELIEKTEDLQDENLMPKPGTQKINWWHNMEQILDIWEK